MARKATPFGALYTGTVAHRRLAPRAHAFSYAVALCYLDVDHVAEVLACYPWWSSKPWRPVRFVRSDYLGDPRRPLGAEVRRVVAEQVGEDPAGPVWMLTQLRTWGWLFNPLTLYFCFRPGGRELAAVVAEVTNTPWGERCRYVFAASPGGRVEATVDKAMHVSPFLDMAQVYRFEIEAPGPSISVRVRCSTRDVTVLEASMDLQRRRLDRRSMTTVLFTHPAMTMKVSAAIYLEALRLALKGVPFHPHPKKQRRSVVPSIVPAPARRPPEALVALAAPVAKAALRRLENAGIVVVEGDRKEHFGVPGASSPPVTLTVHDPAAYAAALRHGSVGLARSYAEGWWEADDLVGFLRLATRQVGSRRSRLGWAGKLATLVPSTESRDRSGHHQDVRAHYDLGDEFFALFLDPTMTYSCATFEHPGQGLEEAQRAKLERICKLLDLSAADELLEIGTGWGSLALHAASRYGCRVVTTTVSERQRAYAQAAVEQAGLSHLVEVRGEDFRDLRGSFDKIASIEMIEAIGWRNFDEFFGVCSRLLRKGGAIALQAIVIAEEHYERAKRREDFIKALVFPGSCLPSVGALVGSAGRAGLRPEALADIGVHYAETLRRWRRRFGEHHDDAAALGFDERFLRLWDLYLAYCEAGFAEGRISDVQLRLTHARASRSLGARRPGP